MELAIEELQFRISVLENNLAKQLKRIDEDTEWVSRAKKSLEENEKNYDNNLKTIASLREAIKVLESQ